MAFIEELVQWSRDVFLPFGEFGLFSVAFMESSFFPIPPDLILIPLCLASPELALWFAFVCTLGSVTGAFFGYWLGLKGGRPLMKKLVSDHKVGRVEQYFHKYGAWAVGISALTPIPYKIFTITSGVMRLKPHKLLVASILGRGGRFFPEAIIIALWGEEIVGFLSEYFGMVTLALAMGVIAAYIIYKKFIRKR